VFIGHQVIGHQECNVAVCWMFPMNTTSTAQYAAVTAKTSCLFALVNIETAVAKSKAKMRVIAAINFVDTVQERKMYMGISSNAVEVTAIMTLIKMLRRSVE
jgi:hypothetical protein